MLVSLDDLSGRLPTPIQEADRDRVELLLEDAETEVRGAFAEAHRDLDIEMAVKPWLVSRVERVIREMVSAVVLIGGSAGFRSVSSSTGAQSDSATFHDPSASAWGNVVLTATHRRELGLSGAAPRFSFPRPWKLP